MRFGTHADAQASGRPCCETGLGDQTRLTCITILAETTWIKQLLPAHHAEVLTILSLSLKQTDAADIRQARPEHWFPSATNQPPGHT